ncbi:MAG: HAD-IA family hydrolase [Solirubrobacterales bacterium]
MSEPGGSGGDSGAALVERAYEAWNSADLEAFLETLDPAVEWRPAGAFPGIGREYLGHAGVRRFWEDFHEPWERIEIEMEEVVEAGEEMVVKIRFTGHGREGISVEALFGQRYRIAGGRLVSMLGYMSWEEASAAALPPSAVIFDNDGLLLDTESVWTRGEQQLFERRGLEFTLEHKQEIVGSPAHIAGAILERRLGEPGRAEELIAELDELVMAELGNGVEEMVGARGLVEELRARAVPIALVSNSPRPFIEKALGEAGLADAFGAIVSGHEVPAPKPEPDPYLEACRRLGVEPGRAVVALEDSPTGVASARAAGLTVIGVPSVPGVELPAAHHAGNSLEDEPVLRRLGLWPSQSTSEPGRASSSR